MKKYLIYTVLLGLLFSACNPNKDIYDNIENNTDPYRSDFEITLSEDDYSTVSDLALSYWAQNNTDSAIADAIDTYKSFAYLRPASVFIGLFLDQEYIAPDSTSSVLVTYNYSVNKYDSLAIFTLTNDDYIAIGGVVADSLAFTYTKLPGTFLPNYLFSLDTTSDYLLYVICDYWENNTTKIDTGMAYEFKDESWSISQTAYTLTDADYESMGAPGAHHNFSDSDKPEHYLPIFLKQKFPFAYNNDMYTIIYDYYSGSTSTLFSAYSYNGTDWNDTYQLTDQFIQNGTQWLFDPTVKHSMVKEDYDILVQYVLNHDDPAIAAYFDDYWKNAEYYYGASTYKDDFDMRLYKRRDNDPSGLLDGLTDDEAKANLTERLKEGLQIYIELRFPTANPVSNGIQVYYEIYYMTYEPGYYFYKMRFKCTDVGKFEYVSGPELLD